MIGAAVAVSSVKIFQHPFSNWIGKIVSAFSLFHQTFFETSEFFFCILKMNEAFGNLSVLHNYINFSLHNNSQQILDGKDNNTAEKYDSTPSVAFLATIFPLMVAGNICVLTLIFRKRGSKTRMDILFANTACADGYSIISLLHSSWFSVICFGIKQDTGMPVMPCARLFGILQWLPLTVLIMPLSF